MQRLILACLAAFILFLVPSLSSAQCTIDYTQTVPGLYPDTLPDGWVGQAYSEDVTFVLPIDTQGFAFTNFHIQSITGLPFGLNWQCNNSGNGCNYDPAISQYGCVNFSGTPILPGTYTLEVLVIASLGVLGDYPTYYYTPLTIHPDTSSNAGFGMANSYGCAPITVEFTNNNPGLMAYNWDFGNGNSSTAENPSPQIYTNPGTYVVQYEAYSDTSTLHFLTEVQVTGIPNNWGWPGDLNPDIYVEIWDATPTLLYTSGTIDDTDPPVTFAIPNLQLNNETYTVHVWDEDGGLLGADDDLGSTTFAGHGGSGASTTGSTSIVYTINQIPAIPTATATDTVYVFGFPSVPNIDSMNYLLWTDSTSLNLQWYANGNPINGADSASYLATQSGDYWVIATTPEGCFSSSDTIAIVICDQNFQPSITVSGNVIYTDSTSNDVQWHSLLTGAMPGETSEFIVNPPTGYYFVTVTSFDGCNYTSDTVFFDPVSVDDILLTDRQISIYPNPNNGQFTLELQLAGDQRAEYQLLDMVGNQITPLVQVTGSKVVEQLDVSGLAPGVYLMTVQSGNNQVFKKIAIR